MSISRLRSSQNNMYCLLKIFISKNSMQLFHGQPQHIFTACSYKKINKSCTCTINNRIKLLLKFQEYNLKIFFFLENLISNKTFRPLHDRLNMLIGSHDRQLFVGHVFIRVIVPHRSKLNMYFRFRQRKKGDTCSNKFSFFFLKRFYRLQNKP